MAPVTNTLTFTLYSVCFGLCSLCFNKSCKTEAGAAWLLGWWLRPGPANVPAAWHGGLCPSAHGNGVGCEQAAQ